MILIQQYNLKKGLELFGDKGQKAVSAELKKIHDMNTYVSHKANELSREEKQKALQALMFIVEKDIGV